MSNKIPKDWNKIIEKCNNHLDECEDHFCNICSNITSGKFLIEEAFNE